MIFKRKILCNSDQNTLPRATSLRFLIRTGDADVDVGGSGGGVEFARRENDEPISDDGRRESVGETKEIHGV